MKYLKTFLTTLLFLSSCNFAYAADTATGTQVIGNTYIFKGTLANDTVAYTANDAIGAKFTITNAFRQKYSGIIQTLVVTNDTTEHPDLTLFCFDADFTGATNNAAFAATDSEVNAQLIFKQDIAAADWRDTALNSVVYVTGIGALVKSQSENVYCQFMIRSATTFAGSSSVRWKMVIAPD